MEKSTTKTRTVNLSNALDKNVIEFMGHRDENKPDEVEVALKMRFDTTNPNNMKIKLEDYQDIYFRKDNDNNKQYEVQLLNKEGNQVALGTVLGRDIANQENGIYTSLNDQRFEYGYKLKIFAWHQDLLRIQGPVRGAKEDYSDGVQQGDSYSSATFEITEEGLKATYDKDTSIDEDRYVTILPTAREGYPFGLRIDLTTNRIEAVNRKAYSIEYGTDEKALEVILYGTDGIEKRRLTMTGNQNPYNHSTQSQALDVNFADGDYITIFHRTPKNLSIRGNKELFRDTKEDYSDGVDDKANIDNLVLKLNDNHVKAIYVDPPTIEGVVDRRIMFKGETFDEEILEEGVTAEDILEGPLTESIAIEHNISKDANNKLNQIGLYDVIYTVRNSKETVTTVKSTVEVQAKPVIQVNEDKAIVELDSVNNTPQDIEEYLRTVVTVTDEEDNAKNLDVKLDINGTFDPSIYDSSTITYTATDSHGNETTKEVTIQVSRTVNVTVPTTIPFQVVTNLKDKEADPFISGILKLQNNHTSEVDVYLDSFTKQESTTTKNKSYGTLEIVNPEDCDWDNLSVRDSMTKMALGMYVKSCITGKSQFVEESPLWLKPNETSDIPLGILPRAESMSTPFVSKFSFTSKHGKNFAGGTSKGKFNLVFRFE